MEQGEEVMLLAILDARINEITLKAEMGMETVRSELDTRRPPCSTD